MSTTTNNTNKGIAHKIARSNILELHPYRCARDDYDSGILLDANENSFGPSTLPTNSIPTGDNKNELERYPDPYQLKLKELIIKNYHSTYGLSPSNIFVGVGSDEAIDLLMRIFCIPSVDNILITPPTYGMYKVCAKVNDIQIIECPLSKEFDLRPTEMLSSITEKTKLVFICSPGNPTSKAIPLSDIEIVCQSYQDKGIIVVDEAYVDFSLQDNGTALSLINKYSNVVVLQTLSKAFGLAGVRCGFAYGSPDVIQLMNNVKAPYNVNTLTSEVAMNAFSITEHDNENGNNNNNNSGGINTLKKNISSILKERDLLIEKLKSMTDIIEHVYHTDSNFILFRVKPAAGSGKDVTKELYTQMANNGVVTRYRGNELYCNRCIRVTVGTSKENETFLQLLTKIYNSF